MPERDRYAVATMAAEAMHTLMEAEYQQGRRDPDAMMVRLKNLSAYSLTHADIMHRREGIELLALAQFFGMISDARFQNNQQRLQLLSPEALEYQGHAEVIKQEIKAREIKRSTTEEDNSPDTPQLRLF